MRIVFNRMVTQSTPAVENLYIPSMKTLVSDDFKSAFAKFDTEATNDEEMFSSLAEYMVSGAITYASFHNQVFIISLQSSFQSCRFSS